MVHVGVYGSGSLTISNGGCVTTTGTGSAANAVGAYSGSMGTVMISGNSTWNNAAALVIGYSGTGVVTQTGGTTTAGGGLCLGYNSTGSGTYNLNVGVGGEFTVCRFRNERLQPRRRNTAGRRCFFNQRERNAFPGTSTIDTQNYSVTWTGNLSGNGTLIKVGSGTLTLSNNNNYNFYGDTVLKSGTLVVAPYGSVLFSTLDAGGRRVELRHAVGRHRRGRLPGRAEGQRQFGPG